MLDRPQPFSAELETVMSRQLGDLEPTLARHVATLPIARAQAPAS